jgi:hypothetical protein
MLSLDPAHWRMINNPRKSQSSVLVRPRTLIAFLFIAVLVVATLNSAPDSPDFLVICHEVDYVFVSAYFDGPSKHGSESYVAWIPHFLKIFVGELYFYTTPHWKVNFTESINVGPNVHFRFNYSSPFEIPCMRRLRSAYEKQCLIDREIDIHKGPHLYAVWNGKICLMSEVSLLVPWAIVFWIDAGSCREEIYWETPFPNRHRLTSVITLEQRGAMIFGAHRPFKYMARVPLEYVVEDLVIGTFYGGDQDALREYWHFFWALHDHFITHGEFVGKDQHLMSTYIAYTDRAWIQPNYEGHCNTWFTAFSFYGDTSRCFHNATVLHPHSEYFEREENNYSLKEWIKSIKVPFHPFGQ